MRRRERERERERDKNGRHVTKFANKKRRNGAPPLAVHAWSISFLLFSSLPQLCADVCTMIKRGLTSQRDTMYRQCRMALSMRRDRADADVSAYARCCVVVCSLHRVCSPVRCSRWSCFTTRDSTLQISPEFQNAGVFTRRLNTSTFKLLRACFSILLSPLLAVLMCTNIFLFQIGVWRFG